MDTTAYSIVLGIVAAVIWAAIKFWRSKTFDVGTVFVICLAGFAIPAGAAAIWAALSGNVNALPQNWREYVAAAGVVSVGLSLHYLISRFRALFDARGKSTQSKDAIDETGVPDKSNNSL